MKRFTYKSSTAKKPGIVLRDFAGHSRFNLQLFAEDGDDKGSDSSGDGGNDSGKDEGGDKDKPRTYTDADVDRIVAKHKADWDKAHQKALEDAKEEARKYERMTKEQKEEADRKKAQEEADKKDARIKELETQIATSELRKTVAADVEAMKEGIAASQDFLDIAVTGPDAKAAKAMVSKLVGIILADRKAQEEKRATGRTPKSYGGGNNNPTDPYAAIAAKYDNKR